MNVIMHFLGSINTELEIEPMISRRIENYAVYNDGQEGLLA